MKKIVGIIGVLLVIIIGVLIYLISLDFTQKEKLKKEVEKIVKLDIKKDQVDMQIKTKGNYAIIEKTIKEYINVCSINYKDLVNILQDERLAEILSAENYKNDGQDFVQSKEYIKNIRANFNDKFSLLMQMVTEDKIKEVIQNKEVDERKIQLYNEIIFEEQVQIYFKELKSNLEESSKILNNILDVQEKVINMLIENKGKWKVDKDKIVFDTKSLVNEYNEYINNL